jgi:hypothetical protein
MKIMGAIAGAVILIMALSASAIVDPPPEDESKPELVKKYIFMPCEALEESYEFQYHQLEHLIEHIKQCKIATDANPDYKYGPLMCLYVRMQWQYMYDHAKSVEKAYNLMCDNSGEPKNRQYEIDF